MKAIEVHDARELALQVLRQMAVSGRKEGGLSATDLLSEAIESSHLSRREEALATELVYGAIRRGLTLDWIIERFSSVEIKRIEPRLLNILRLGVLQLLYVHSVPDYAAVNESVELARAALGKKAAGFANAVLRKVPSDASALPFPSREKDPVSHFSIIHSHPGWLIRRWIGRFGESKTESLCFANNLPPPITARVNTLKTSRGQLLERLAAEGIDASPCDDDQMIELVRCPCRLTNLRAFRDGLFYLQDVSAAVPPRTLLPSEGMKVLDLCSAPGGKATHLAELMHNRGIIVACDIDHRKMPKLRENIERLSTAIVHPIVADATKMDALLKEKFDRVLLDAPCSNTGVFRRRVEARWRLKPRGLALLAQTQLALLRSASRVLKKSGILVYSTCSIEPEENEELVRSFLRTATGFVLLGEINFVPKEKAGDGGYVARLGKS